ncbi:MAG TPA: TIGR03667 family PPOX class F420-dependent oxidoreductase [Ktedonobacterales bacterium]|nr:TIGR03667 family PPOX class F420-dependent oxidoreductase [Ktedonobacterales bacterium]
MASVLPSPSTPFGERVLSRLRDELIIWLTTVGADATPQPNPVWFLWADESVLVYSLPNAARMRNIERNPRVALNFDGNGQGGEIIVIAGEARISHDDPPADQVAAYTEKYKDFIARHFGTPANFAAEYSTPLRITPLKVRGG